MEVNKETVTTTIMTLDVVTIMTPNELASNIVVWIMNLTGAQYVEHHLVQAKVTHMYGEDNSRPDLIKGKHYHCQIKIWWTRLLVTDEFFCNALSKKILDYSMEIPNAT